MRISGGGAGVPTAVRARDDARDARELYADVDYGDWITVSGLVCLACCSDALPVLRSLHIIFIGASGGRPRGDQRTELGACVRALWASSRTLAEVRVTGEPCEIDETALPPGWWRVRSGVDAATLLLRNARAAREGREGGS